MAWWSYTCIFCSWYALLLYAFFSDKLSLSLFNYVFIWCMKCISGSPLLGATESVKATLSGFTFGLPVAEVLSSLPPSLSMCAWTYYLIVTICILLIFMSMHRVKSLIALLFMWFFVIYYRRKSLIADNTGQWASSTCSMV